MNSFFDNYPEFYKTSITGSGVNRLNSRYSAIIENNKNIILGSSILDIASHDGRWSFAAIKNGASQILGIEGKSHLVNSSNRNFEKYNIPSNTYNFEIGDIHKKIKLLSSNKYDVIFCFGFLYHTYQHTLLFSEMKRLNPKYIILDVRISLNENPIVELSFNDPKIEGSAINFDTDIGKVLVGKPSKLSLEMMLEYYGFRFNYYDWKNHGITDWDEIEDYRDGYRVSLVATSIK
jgi:hypothetical protein